MGYSTRFVGRIRIEPALSVEEADYLRRFGETYHMERPEGPYYAEGYVDRPLPETEEEWDEFEMRAYPPCGQPSRYCDWTVSKDRRFLKWSGDEKSALMDLWLEYLLVHFLGSAPRAASELPFLKGHVLSGVVRAYGESRNDRWSMEVQDNRLEVTRHGDYDGGDTGMGDGAYAYSVGAGTSWKARHRWRNSVLEDPNPPPLFARFVSRVFESFERVEEGWRR